MRKIILGVAVSLDGYIEGPNGVPLQLIDTKTYNTGLVSLTYKISL